MSNSRLDLSEDIRGKSIGLLQQGLCLALDLEAQMKHAHWNVRGLTFFQLHDLFDKIHTDVEDLADTIAERLAALGGVADGRVQTTAKATALKEYPLEAGSGDVHLKAIATAIAQFAQFVRHAIEDAATFGDAGTSDVFTQASRDADKHLWLVEAHLLGGGDN